MNDKTYSISVVLPNYNGKGLLKNNLPSLVKALDGIEHEIIVVDDCSSDDSVAYLAATYPDIIVIQNEVNQGFATTCNKGIRAARNELLCVSNTDVTFTGNYFTCMLHEFEDKDLFAVKGDILNYASSYEDVLNIDRTTAMYYKRGFLRFDTSKPMTERAVLTATSGQFVSLGCCFVCRSQMMLELGGYDAIYSPFYWEDSDLAQRALKKGFKLLYLPEAKVYHQASSTIGSYRSNSLRRVISNRNKFIFTWRHMDSFAMITSHVMVTVLNVLFRWITLDWKYYTALYKAVFRVTTFREQDP